MQTLALEVAVAARPPGLWRRLLLLLLVVVALLAALAPTPWGRTAGLIGRTLLLVPDLFASQPVRPLVALTPPPVVSEETIPGRAMTAVLYLPGGRGPHPALVLTLGVHPVPPTDRALVRLADGLARTGLAVLIVQSEDLVQDRILPGEADNLVAAFQYAQAREGVDRRRVGLMGFSAGASLAALAAADPRIRDDVAVLGWLGGYGSALAMIDAIATQRVVPLEPTGYRDDPPGILGARPAGEPIAWKPDWLSRYIFARQLVDLLGDPGDRAILGDVFLREHVQAESWQALPRDPPAGLGAEGRLVYELFTTADPARVAALVPRLPPAALAQMEAISPLPAIGRMRAPMVVMHERGDHLVPFPESVTVAAARSPEARTHLYLFNLFDHVRPNRSLSPLAFAQEVARLYSAVLRVLSYLTL